MQLSTYEPYVVIPCLCTHLVGPPIYIMVEAVLLSTYMEWCCYGSLQVVYLATSVLICLHSCSSLWRRRHQANWRADPARGKSGGVSEWDLGYSVWKSVAEHWCWCCLQTIGILTLQYVNLLKNYGVVNMPWYAIIIYEFAHD